MAANNKDEILSRFIGITQCSSKDAREYLESAKWNEQAAVDFFFDSVSAQVPNPVPVSVPKSKPPETRAHAHPTGKPKSNRPDGYESDDDLLQSALAESLQLKPRPKSPVAVPQRSDNNKSIVSTKINTFDTFRRNRDGSDDDDDDEEEGQAFYAGGSERSGQQIIGPPKPRDNDKKVTKLFEAARKQGATEAQDNESTSSRAKHEKPFAGVGRSLGDNNTPSHPQGQSPSGATAAGPSNVVEKLPIRFYSNGFTVGDGELRKFEDNKEFMDYIQRSEVPPELRSMNTNGRQIEVSLEDHRGEEYKRLTPAFKPFGGAGHTVGLPGVGQAQLRSSVASSANTTTGSPDASRLEQLAEKRLKTTSTSTTIRLRLPDLSTPVCVKIDLNRTLGDIRRFLTENVPSLQANTFEFMEPPATKIKRDDEKRKISDTHLSNSTLVIRRMA